MMRSALVIVAAAAAATACDTTSFRREQKQKCIDSCNLVSGLAGTADRREWLRKFGCPWPCSDAQLSKIEADEVSWSQQELGKCLDSCDRRYPDPKPAP
jgi:hypothetical protein